MSDDAMLDAGMREQAFLENEQKRTDLEPHDQLILRQMQLSVKAELGLREKAKRHLTKANSTAANARK